MKNKLYLISAAILTLSVILCACGKKEPAKETTSPAEETATTAAVAATAEQTEIITETATYVDESGYHVVSIYVPTSENAEPQSYTHPPVPTHKNDFTYKTETLPQSQDSGSSTPDSPDPPKLTQPQKPAVTKTQTTVKVTERATQPVTVPEKSNGLSILFKSDNVSKGGDAAITVNGEKGKEYSIEVYRNGNDETLTSDTLKPVKADENGFASWTFSTSSCDKGYRKIIIREKNSDKYIQTSILVV